MTKTKILLALLLGIGITFILEGSANAATITVGTTADNTTVDGICTLREAITNSNDNVATFADCVAGSGTDTIAFSVAGTISTGSLLPTMTDPVVLDGSTAPGASCSAAIILALPSGATAPHTLTIAIDNTGAGTGPVLELGAGSIGSTIRGLNVREANSSGSLDGNGINVLGSGGGFHTIECNYIGTDLAGGSAAPNDDFGIADNGTGSPSSVYRNNLISGNIGAGIIIGGISGVTNTISGNIIGTNAAGTGAIPNTDGVLLAFSSTDTVVRGNLVSGNSDNGVEISAFGASTSNDVFGNFIGTDITGLSAIPNAKGVEIMADDNRIGSVAVSDRNLISGNSGTGVVVSGGTGNSIVNNWVGVDITGLTALANGVDGIRHVTLGPNTIGGTTSSHRNIISGNGDDGIQLDSGGATSDALIQNNWIGVSADGSLPIGNGQRGIEIGFGDRGGNMILDNVISANGEHGVGGFRWGDGSVDTYERNFFGTNTLGEVEAGFGNTAAGIGLTSGGPHTIGGSDPSDANIIAGNGAGVVIWETTGVDVFTKPEVTILGNSIYDNEGWDTTSLGIDLAFSETGGSPVDDTGPNANDEEDPDTGPNNFINFIEATSASNDSGTQVVDFDMDVPKGDYRVEFFASDEADPSGFGEGQNFLGAVTVSHGGMGTEAFTAVFPNPDADRILSSTVTEDLGGGNYGVTSEFSAVFQPNFDGLAETGVNQTMKLYTALLLITSGAFMLNVGRVRAKHPY